MEGDPAREDDAAAEVAAERLRRRLYAPGATDDDVLRFRAATPAPQREPAQVTASRAGRRWRSLVAGALVVVVLGAALVLAGVRPPVVGARPTASTAAAPLRLALRPVRLPGADAERRVDDLFDTAQVASTTAADDLGALVMLEAAPEAEPADLERTGSGGVFDGRTARVALPAVRVRRGDLLVLSVVARRPVRVAWRFTAGAPRGGASRTVLVARSGRDRVSGGAIRIQRSEELDGFVIAGAGSTVLRYRYALYRHRPDAPLEPSVSAALFRCAFDRSSGESRCAREG